MKDKLVLDYNNKDNFNVLNNYKNLKSLTLKNYRLDKKEFYILISLENLEDITFDHCTFYNSNTIAVLKLKSLSLINCYIKNYDFVYIIDTLEELEIINGTVEIVKLNYLKNLKFLLLSNSKVLDNTTKFNSNIEELYIENTNIKDLSILDSLNNLKLLSLDQKQIDNNKTEIDKLKKRNISIYLESIYEIGDEDEA